MLCCLGSSCPAPLCPGPAVGSCGLQGCVGPARPGLGPWSLLMVLLGRGTDGAPAAIVVG